jgi:hypothetical protein
MSVTRAVLCSLVMLWAAGCAAPAGAAMLFSDTVLVKGREYLTVVELPLDSIGTYKITATDLKWFGTPLEALSFGVFTATQPVSSLQGPGTLEFFKAGPGKVFLQLYARATGPRFAGLVTLQAEGQPPVPLPASVLLLASALGAGALARGAKRLREGMQLA